MGAQNRTLADTADYTHRRSNELSCSIADAIHVRIVHEPVIVFLCDNKLKSNQVHGIWNGRFFVCRYKHTTDEICDFGMDAFGICDNIH